MGETCTSLSNAVLEAGFCAFELPVVVDKPRSVVSLGVANSLVLERTTASVVHLFDSDDDLVADSRRTLATASGLNHGLAVHNGYIYASSDTTVYRWPYTGDFETIGSEEIVVVNMNADGKEGAPQGHTTRTLAFDELGRLYISVGSYENVDADSHRSRIRRFDIYGTSVVFPIDFQFGEVFADGLRNEVGLAFDSYGVLWGVENGADMLFRSDLGGDIHADNLLKSSTDFSKLTQGSTGDTRTVGRSTIFRIQLEKGLERHGLGRVSWKVVKSRMSSVRATLYRPSWRCKATLRPWGLFSTSTLLIDPKSVTVFSRFQRVTMAMRSSLFMARGIVTFLPGTRLYTFHSTEVGMPQDLLLTFLPTCHQTRHGRMDLDLWMWTLMLVGG